MAIASTWHNENGFEYALFPAPSGKPESLIIFMHGLGSDTYISDECIRAIRKKIPSADVIALQGPIKIKKSYIPNVTRGYSWFHLFDGSVAAKAKTWLSHVFNRLSVAEKVEAFAHAELTKRGLTEDNLAYMGTSMGGIVALQAGLTGEKPVAAIVSRGGAILPLTKIKTPSKVFLQVGELDELFNNPPLKPGEGFLKRAFSLATGKLTLKHKQSAEFLKKNNVPLTEKIYPKQGHALNNLAWDDGIDFIAKALPPPKPKTTP